jgi:DNA-binding transcriptional ArsR family regulator
VEHVPTAVREDQLGQAFAALANPTRRAIVARLAAGEATVNELAEPFDLTLPAISKHIKVLEHAGLVVRTRRAQTRPCTLDTAVLEDVSAWAERCKQTWNARLDRMDDQLRKKQGRTREKRAR